MSVGIGNAGEAGLFGATEQIGVSRAVTELRAGRAIFIRGVDTMLVVPVDALNAARLAAFRRLGGAATPHLAITQRRAQALGLNASGPVCLELAPETDAAAILAPVFHDQAPRPHRSAPAGPMEEAAVELAKLAQILPAVLVATVSPETEAAHAGQILAVDLAGIAAYRDQAAAALVAASDAELPLANGINARIVVFRDGLGQEPAALVVGHPDPAKPVPLRIHSACLTGDVFGSRRCDCGDQLRLALQRLHELGGGIVLYLAQEGRGVGLANKMRTYRLQDGGLDTVDANTTLGFDDDERDYGQAARMLQLLGWRDVVLLTNNPAKLDGLAAAGITVAGRVALEATINPDNHRYMSTKANRAGHTLQNLLTPEFAQRAKARVR